MNSNGDIQEWKRRLPMPQLMERLGCGDRVKRRARCPFHKPDRKPSFSVFQSAEGQWFWRCHAGCGGGDEINLIEKALNFSNGDAIRKYGELAGFFTQRPESHEYHKSPESPESPKYREYPVSNGQAPEKDLLAEKDLKGLAAHNACTAHGTARTRRWQLVRDLRAVELRHGALDTAELMLTFDHWYRRSQRFLDSQKTRNDDYLAAFLAEFGKVRVPTGEGETITEALASVSRLSRSKLPEIPGMPDAPESWHRIAALHRELSRRSANGIYFLSCRDAAKAFPGLSHQAAYNINLALAQLGVTEIVHRGDPRPNEGRASQFRYLLPETENAPGAEEDDQGFDL